MTPTSIMDEQTGVSLWVGTSVSSGTAHVFFEFSDRPLSPGIHFEYGVDPGNVYF